MASPKDFLKQGSMTTHRVSSSPSKVIPAGGNRQSSRSASAPASLKISTGCASCRKRRG
ncbi:MAG: hypothetical protein NC080_07430 [Paraprevotella sp.]|nr:hypothetical protein [Paraprevotella sp.]